MNSKYRVLSCLTAALIIASTLVSCGGQAESPTDTAQSSNGETTAAETDASEARLALADNLPDRDFEGYKFTILTYSAGTYYVEEETGDVLVDAVYKRNSLVEERFNCEIAVSTSPGIQELDASLKSSVLAGDNSYDLAIPHQITSGPGFITGHYIGDWNAVPYIDMTQPWWNQTINQTISILGSQYYIAGYITNPDPFAMLYNKAYISNYGFENMYDVVRDGRWTIDLMLDMTKQVSTDIDGDGMFTDKDQYGFTMNNDNTTLNFMYASGIMSVLVDEDGYPQPNVNNDKMQSLVEKLYSLIYDDNRTLYTTYATQNDLGYGGFKDGRIMFVATGVSTAIALRDSEIDFGLIPYPMYDENQDGYHTHVDAWNGMLCYPVTATNLERTGIITEALAAYSYKYVTPAYYDVALGTKYLRDDESIEMMNLIYDGIVYDFGYIFDAWKGCTWTLPRLMGSKSTDLASYWASVEKSVNKNYEDLYAAITEG